MNIKLQNLINLKQEASDVIDYSGTKRTIFLSLLENGIFRNKENCEKAFFLAQAYINLLRTLENFNIGGMYAFFIFNYIVSLTKEFLKNYREEKDLFVNKTTDNLKQLAY